jgi:hypothetical protein
MKPPTYYGCSGCGIVSTLASAFTPHGNGRWCVDCLAKRLAPKKKVW